MKHLVVYDLRLCPVDADQVVAWRNDDLRRGYLAAQEAHVRAHPNDPMPLACWSIARSLDSLDGHAITARACWDDYLLTLRELGHQLDTSRPRAFVAAWIALQFLPQHGTRRPQREIHRADVTDQVIRRLRSRSLSNPTSWTDKHRALIAATVLTLLETPEGAGRITWNSLFHACVRAIWVDDSIGDEHTRRTIERLIHEVWAELEPA